MSRPGMALFDAPPPEQPPGFAVIFSDQGPQLDLLPEHRPPDAQELFWALWSLLGQLLAGGDTDEDEG